MGHVFPSVVHTGFCRCDTLRGHGNAATSGDRGRAGDCREMNFSLHTLWHIVIFDHGHYHFLTTVFSGIHKSDVSLPNRHDRTACRQVADLLALGCVSGCLVFISSRIEMTPPCSLRSRPEHRNTQGLTAVPPAQRQAAQPLLSPPWMDGLQRPQEAIIFQG